MLGEFPATKIIYELERDRLLPAILFRSARKQCDGDIVHVSRQRGCLLPVKESERIRGEVEAIIQKYAFPREVIEQHPHYSALTTTGVGAHHAGQLLMWRLLLEELMTRGVLRLLIATGTVAAGVDFPARTVVITAHSKRGSEGFNVLTAAEFQQMSGRAGRRGKDAVGICLIAPSQYSDARLLSEVSIKPPEPLKSAYFAAPSTVLNLLKYRNVDDLWFTISKSFAAFLDKKGARRLREEATTEQGALDSDTEMKDVVRKKAQKRINRLGKEAELLEQRQETLLRQSLDGLTTLGYVEQGKLSPKGYWGAHLCTNNVLELAEMIDSALLNDLSPELLAGLVASVSGDPHRSYLRIKKNPIPKETFKKIEEMVARVKAAYQNPFASEVKVLPDAALTVMEWMGSEAWQPFASLVRLAGAAEGDVARLVTQTAENLNQISKLEDSHPGLAVTAVEARMRLLRPPLTESLAVAV